MITEKQQNFAYEIYSRIELAEEVGSYNFNENYRRVLLDLKKEDRIKYELRNRYCKLTKKEARMFISKYLPLYKEIERQFRAHFYDNYDCSGYDRRAYGIYSMDERWD